MEINNNKSHWLSRTELFIGNDGIERLKKAHVLVVGLGGVGSMAAEMLTRAGIGKLTIVDGDVVNETNINRQMPALVSTLSKSKALVVAERLRDINPNIKLNIIEEYIKDQKIIDITAIKYDYVIDAIDTLSPKIYLIFHAFKNNQRIVSSMGAGGKIDPLQIKVDDLSKSYNCALAFDIRKKLRKLGVTTGVKVVFSSEMINKKAVVSIEYEQNKKSMVGTISYMPPMFGCYCASVVIRDLIKE